MNVHKNNITFLAAYQIMATSDATKVSVVAFSSSVYARTRFNSHQSLMTVTVFVPFAFIVTYFSLLEAWCLIEKPVNVHSSSKSDVLYTSEDGEDGGDVTDGLQVEESGVLVSSPTSNKYTSVDGEDEG
jgi:hypothetical protein